MDTGTIIDSLFREINTILVLLERPIVRSQLIYLLIILAISGLLSLGIIRLNQRYRFLSEGQRWQKNLRILLENLFFPVLTFVVLLMVIAFFRRQESPIAILLNARIVVLLFVGYELFVTSLYLRFEESRIKPIHDRILWPAVLLLVFYLVLGNFINITVVRTIPLAFLGDGTVTVGTLFRGLLVVYIFGTAAYFMKDTQRRVQSQQRGQAKSAALSSILIVGRYLIIGIGVIFLAGAFGINLTTLAFIGGGLSIGVGFGLQQIIANFISGILLLFEQSLRPGDVVDLDGNLGQVKQVNMRSTTILTRDNIEIIVPNERFLTTAVTTYTRNNNMVRVKVPYGISYDGDPLFVRDLVLKTVATHGGVHKTPAPEVYFIGFGDSSVDFEVLVWMDQPNNIPRFRSDLYFMIWTAFAKHDIEIPFPQRDLHLRSGWEMNDESQVAGDE